MRNLVPFIGEQLPLQVNSKKPRAEVAQGGFLRGVDVFEARHAIRPFSMSMEDC